MNPTILDHDDDDDDDNDDHNNVRCGPKVETLCYDSYEHILSACHAATSLEEQERYFHDLISFLEGEKWSASSSLTDRNNDDQASSMMKIIAQESIARRILTEWPYRQLSGTIDRI